MPRPTFEEIMGEFMPVDGQQRPVIVPEQVKRQEEQNRQRMEELLRLSDPTQAYNARVGAEEGYGYATASEMERDFRNLSDLALENKYGPVVARVLRESGVAAATMVNQERAASRSNAEALKDFGIGVVQGAVEGVGGLTALGLSLAGQKDEAVSVAEFNRSFREQGDSLKSEENRTARRRAGAASANAMRDSDAQYEADLENTDENSAKALRIMREFGDSWAINSADSVNVQDILAEATGDLATDILGAVGGVSIARRLAGVSGKTGRVAREGAAVGSIAAQEAGGTYQQAVQQSLDMLQERDDLTDQEKILLADKAGQIASQIQAPVAAVTGLLVSRFVGGGVTASRLMDIGPNMVKEGLEETLQSGAGAFAVNTGLEQTVDAGRDVFRGIGSEAATGALGGIGAGGIASTPGAAAELTGKAGRVGLGAASVAVGGAAGIAKIIADANPSSLGARVIAGARKATEFTFEQTDKMGAAISARRDRFDEEARKSSAVRREAVSEAMSIAVANMSQNMELVANEILDSDLSEDDKERALQTLNDLDNVTRFSLDELEEDAPEEIRNLLASATNRFEAIQLLESVLDQESEPTREKAYAAAKLLMFAKELEDAATKTTDTGLERLNEDSVALQAGVLLQNAVKLSSSNQDTVLKGVEQAKSTLEAYREQRAQAPVQEAELDTPEGKTKVQATLAQATSDPLKASPEAIQTILEHSTSGRLELTPNQKKTLQAASILLQAERKRLEAIEKDNLGIVDVVSNDALTDRRHDPELSGPSLSGHLQRIVGAYRQNDLEAATSYLEDLMLFAQHMQNKVAAFNDHYAQGGGGENTGVFFDALDRRKRKFDRKSAKRAYVQPTNKTSVRLVQTAAREAQIIGETANELAAVFDDLGVEPLNLVSLAQELQGDVDQIVKREQVARRTKNAREQREAQKQKQEAKQAEQAEQTQEESEAEVSEESVAPATESETVAETQTEIEETNQTEQLELQLEAVQERVAELEAGQAEEAAPDAAVESAEEVSDPEPVETPDVVEEPVEASNEAVKETADLQTEPEIAPETIKDRFPGMIAGAKNRFLKAFKLAQDPESILARTSEPPIEMIGILLSEGVDVEQAAAYGEIISAAEDIKAALNKRVREYLLAPASAKSKETNFDRILNDGALLGYARGKALNLVDTTDGKVRYNDQLVEIAVIAAMQWLITADRYKARRSTRNLANIFNVRERDFELTLGANTQAVQDMFEAGLTLTEAASSLRDMITRYWGLAPNKNAPEGDIVGIPEALAKEILTVMVKNKMLGQSEPLVDIMGYNPFAGEDKNPGPKRLVLTPTTVFTEPVIANPDAIESAVMTRNQQRSGWVGTPPPQGAGVLTQLTNRNVPLTREQRDHKRYREHVPFRLNETMWNLYKALGEENVLRLWGGGDIQEGQLNKGHYATLKGRNATFRSQFQSVQRVVAQLAEYGRQNGMNTADVPMYYEYGFDSRSRPLMQGDNNPQRSKLMRAMMLPTRATVDISDSESQLFKNFMMAIGQHIGVKVERYTVDVIVAETQKKLDEQYGKVVAGLEAWLGSQGEISQDLVDQIKAAIGDGSDPVIVQSLIEYARFRRATPEERANFTTDIYIEADGKTNGPINAMSLFAVGEFTGEELANLQRGGNFIEDSKAYHEQYAEDEKDLYETTADRAAKLIQQALNRLSGPEKKHGQKIKWLLNQFSDGDFVIGNDGKIEVDRGLLKNPLTITLYGSSSGGIAQNITSEISRNIYKRMSDAMARMRENENLTQAEAMFPDSLDPAEDMRRFIVAVRDLSQISAKTSKGVIELTREEGVNLPDESFLDFEITGRAAFNMSTNLQAFIVNPMTQAIEETTGASTNWVLNLIRRTTQVHGIFLAAEMRRKVNEYIAERKAAGTWNNEDSLTRKELEKIFYELKAMAPVYELNGQNLLIAQSGRTDLMDTAFSANLSRGKGEEKFVTPGSVSGFRDPGVRGMPGFVISAGDAAMMQIFTDLMKGGLRSLDVFDGLNVPIDAMQSMSERINEAVLKTWEQNPISALRASFEQFAQYARENADNIELTREDRIALSRAILDIDPSKGAEIDDASLSGFLAAAEKQLSLTEMKIQARRNALARVNRSVDQMAAVGSPHTTSGGISLSGMDVDAKADVLKKLYHEELEKLMAEKAPAEPKTETVVFTPTEVKNAGTYLKLPNAQKQLLGRLLNGLSERGYRIVQGTAKQVNDQLTEWGVRVPPSPIDRDVHGFTLPGERVVALIGGTGETLVHELIHAATYEQVVAYYNDDLRGQLTNEQLDALDRIVHLGRQFLDLDVSNESSATQRAYRDAVAAMERELEKDNEAGALNEFMAWALSNQDLANLLKDRKASSLARMAQKTVAFLKNLIFGKGKSSKVGTDMLSNLRFNTEIVAEKPVSISETLGGTIQYHSTEFGNDENLVKFQRTLLRKVVSHLDARNAELPENRRKKVTSEDVAAFVASSDELFASIEHAFPMNVQQMTSFQLIYTALRGLNVLDGNALLRVGQLYDHVLQTGDRSLFKRNDDPLDDADNYQASNKWAVLTGRWGNMEMDEFGRSNLIPMFLTLAVVHPEMKAALRGVPLPAKERNLDGTLDAVLENWAASGMDYLDRALSGETGSEADVNAVLDAIQERVVRVSDERRSMMGMLIERTGNMTDRLNEGAKAGIQKGSEWLYEKATTVKQNSDKKFVQMAANGARVIAGVANERIGNDLAERATSEVNRKEKVPQFVRNLMNDLIGRTENNAPVYDLIKRVRTWVQQRRQEFREHLPVAIANQFSRKLTEKESADLFKGLAKTDFAVLHNRYTFKQMLSLLENPQNIAAEIRKFENELAQMQPDARTQQILLDKSKQLANFMNTGVHGPTLLRNAYAISAMLDIRPKGYQEAGGQVDVIDHLVSLYALDSLSVDVKESLGELASSEAAAMQYVIAYLEGQRKEEVRRADGMAFYNHYKGYIPSEATKEGTLIVALDSEAESLVKRSFVRVGAYEGSSLDRGTQPRSYYYSPVSSRAVYQQGILQTVQQTAGGVDLSSGKTHGRTTSGMIDDYVTVSRIWKSRANEKGKASLLPVFDRDGSIVGYERTIDPEQLTRFEMSQDIAKNMGVWAGRQVEEEEGREVNRLLISRLKDMYDEDIKTSPDKEAEYVNLFSSAYLKQNKVAADLMQNLPQHTINQIASVFGDRFMVRRDMLDDAMGYRDASVRNFWDGQANVSPSVLKASQEILRTTFGNNAYKYAVKAEELVKNVVTDLRVLIVVKSVIVPAANLTWNVVQLATRGVPLNSVRKGFPQKVAEVNEYLKTRERMIELEAQKRAAGADILRVNKLEAEIQILQDRQKNLSIWPLVEAGEFTSISDGMLSKDDLALSEGRLTEYFEKLVDRLPGPAKTAARYGFITRDTALFKGLQRAIEYGDFLGKAVLFDDLTKRQGKTQEEALAAVTEEFVNYDRLPGRVRGYMEQMGLLWFWHFKLRSQKVAVGMLRNNPVHALITMNMPFPDVFGPLGSPITDNAVAVIADGRAGYSIGPGMGFRAPGLNPWLNVVN